MSTATVPELSAAFLPALLDLLPSGVVCYTPAYDAASALVDLRFAYLNPAAQRMLRLPAQPTASYTEQFPASRTNGGLAFHLGTYQSEAPGHFELNYQADGYDNYFLVDARRVGDALLVTFTDTATQPRTYVERALRESQAREQQARAEAELALHQTQEQRGLLAQTLGEVPASVATLSGPEHRFVYINDHYRELTAGRAAVGYTVAELLPEVVGQGFIGLLDGVYTTGRPHVGKETPIQLRDATGRPVQRHVDFLYQPLTGELGQVTGILVFAVDVTEKVQARSRVQDLNEELAATNEELRASNEEYLLANTELAKSQQELHILNQELHALNQELHARMATEVVLRQAEAQQALLMRTLGQVPAAVATFTGPEHRHSYFNENYLALASGRAALGLTVAEVLPEMVQQGLVGLLHDVYTTGRPYVGRETPVQLLAAATGQLTLYYLDFVYQPLLDEQGQPQSILLFAVDVSEQVRARQQVERKERETNDLNEELQAANEEIRANNNELTYTQAQLRQLNSQLEARVAERTRAVEAAQQATEHQRSLLQRVLEQAPVAIAIMAEPSHRIIIANARMAAIWGRPVAQLLGQPYFEVLPDTAGQGLEAVFAGVFENGEPATLSEQLTYLDRAGTGQPTAHYLHMVFEPLRDELGHITGVIASATDVTELVVARQQVEDKRRETNDLNEELQAANEEIQANNDELERVQAALRELNEGLEARVVKRTRQVEAALKEAQQQREQLRVQQGLLSQILRLAPATIATLHGPEHRFTFFNEQFQQLAGGRAQLGSTMAELFPEAGQEGFVELLDQVYATGQPLTRLEAEIRLPNPTVEDGKPWYIDFTYQPLVDAKGQVEGILTFSIDASARVLARQQVQQLNKELAARNHELTTTIRQLTRTNSDLDNFIYTASHDLKAPISNIEGLLNLLGELLPAPMRADAEVAPVLSLMQGAVERFTRTIGHLTDVTKLQLEFAQPAVPTPLAPLIDDVCQDMLPLLTAAGATLEIDVDDCHPRVFSAKNLRSIIYNLLSNAVKYRAPGRPPLVQIACRTQGSVMRLTVQDNGLGLDAQQQSRLFQLFQRLHTHVEGTGLGLYMVKSIVENAGGALAVQSQLNAGTTFILTFPA